MRNDGAHWVPRSSLGDRSQEAHFLGGLRWWWGLSRCLLLTCPMDKR